MSQKRPFEDATYPDPKKQPTRYNLDGLVFPHLGTIINTPSIVELYLSKYTPHEEDEWITTMPHLQRLEFHDTRITQSLSWVANIPVLRRLGFTFCDIRAEHVPFEKFTQLYGLSIVSSTCEGIPDGIQYLTQLEDLYISQVFSALTAVPEWITQLTKLERLELYENCFESLPNDFGNLCGLKKIHLSGNRLHQLPQSFSQLTNLVELSLNSNPLIDFPTQLCCLPTLSTLYLHDTQIHTIPTHIGRLTSLRSLYMNGTTLKSISLSIARLPRLDLFDIKGDQVRYPLAISAIRTDFLGRRKFPDLHALMHRRTRIFNAERRNPRSFLAHFDIDIAGMIKDFLDGDSTYVF